TGRLQQRMVPAKAEAGSGAKSDQHATGDWSAMPRVPFADRRLDPTDPNIIVARTNFSDLWPHGDSGFTLRAFRGIPNSGARRGRTKMAPPARSTLLPIVTTGTVTKAAKEEIMTRLISTTVLLLLVGGTSARADGPWCAFYDVSTYNCGFYSWQQCYDTIRGV